MNSPSILSFDIAQRLATQTLPNLLREYPAKLDHVINGPEDLRSPRELHPLFFGSFDWHSCIHGYWQVLRLRRLFPSAPFASDVDLVLDAQITPENVAAEISYFHRPNAMVFERPYGWAWLLALMAELSIDPDDKTASWHRTLMPLAHLIVERFVDFIAKSPYPNRSGTHGNSAFALAIASEYAAAHRDRRMTEQLNAFALRWYRSDVAAQAWEPSWDDFLSPVLIEAECMRRILPADDYESWLSGFLPDLCHGQPANLMRPVQVVDRADLKTVHLDGLNLSRAWCWRSIALSVRNNKKLFIHLNEVSNEHLAASFPHVNGDYSGGHWLATFALLALS